MDNKKPNLSDHPVIVLVAFVAGLITIFIFVTGKNNLPEWFNDAQVTIEETKPTDPTYKVVDWTGWGDYNSQNLELSAGASELFGIPFLTGWTLTTSSGSIQNPASYTFDVNVPNPTHVYVLIQSGWGYNQFANKQIGYIRLEYQDGTLTDVPLVLGYNIRDWVREPNHTVSVITATSPDLQEAWRGRTVAGQLGGIDLLTIQIPTTKQNSTLRSVSFVDTTETTTSSLDPAMHIVGMTIESRTR